MRELITQKKTQEYEKDENMPDENDCKKEST